MPGPAAQFHTLLGQVLAAVQQPRHFIGTVMQAVDQLANLLGRCRSALGQTAHLIGHHGKTAPGFTRPCRFDRRVQGQQVGLLGDRLDHIQDAANALAFARQVLHGCQAMVHLPGQLFDTADGFGHHLVAHLRLLVGVGCGQRGLFGVLRHFLHGGAHLVHGGGHLVGFLTLLVDAQLGVFAAGRQLRSGL
ncbi:hypothetical protein D9M73_155760 [compost metagenome]